MSNGTVTIINTKPYNLQPVPEPGKEYHIFDDGKIKPSRHYTAKIVEVIPFNECGDSEPEVLDAYYIQWREQVEECYWLFAATTDYFIKAISDFDKNPLYFVRTNDGGWFSIDYPGCWMGARLDIDGSLYNKMIENYGKENI
jgi:hypothetical protein